MSFSTEFDTFVHDDCVRDELHNHPDNREADIMARELGIKPFDFTTVAQELLDRVHKRAARHLAFVKLLANWSLQQHPAVYAYTVLLARLIVEDSQYADELLEFCQQAKDVDAVEEWLGKEDRLERYSSVLKGKYER